MSRRGMSLLEMLIALSLTGAVALLAWSILQTAAFHLRDRSERIGMEHALRVAVVGHASGPGVAGAGLHRRSRSDAAGARRVHRPRRPGQRRPLQCRSAHARGQERPRTGGRSSEPRSAGRDSMLVGTTLGPDRWAAVALDADPLPGSCPDGAPALILPARLAPADLAAVGPGSPVRLFEPMELRAYSSGWRRMARHAQHELGWIDSAPGRTVPGRGSAIHVLLPLRESRDGCRRWWRGRASRSRGCHRTGRRRRHRTGHPGPHRQRERGGAASECAVNRRGVALLFAVAVIAALGMISLTGFGLARMEREAGLAAVAEVQARGAAEAALADAMAGWPRAQTPVLPGQETLLTTVMLPGPVTGQAVVRALGGPVFSIRASGDSARCRRANLAAIGHGTAGPARFPGPGFPHSPPKVPPGMAAPALSAPGTLGSL